MAFILVVLMFIAKILLGILAAAALLALLLMVLPVRSRVSGGFRFDGDFEAFLDGEGSVALGGTPCDPNEDDKGDGTAVTLTWETAISARVLGGALGIDYSKGRGLDVAVFGMRFVPQRAPSGAQNFKEESSKPGKRIGPTHVSRGGEDSGKADADRSLAKKESRSLKFSEIKKWLAPDIRRNAVASMRNLFRSLHLRGHVDVECGLPDPAATGMANAAFLTWSGA